MLYIGNETRGIQNSKNREELGTTRCTALCTCTLNCMYICMYFIACYFELLLWTIYMNCNIDICVTCVTVNEHWWLWMNFGKDKQHILTSKQKYFSFVFKYSKRTCFQCNLSVQTNHSITQASSAYWDVWTYAWKRGFVVNESCNSLLGVVIVQVKPAVLDVVYSTRAL